MEFEKANIIINRTPYDKKEGRDYRKPGGIRLGTSKRSGLEVEESEMDKIAGS